MSDGLIGRRTFTVGLGVAVTGITPVTASGAPVPTSRRPGQPSYDEKTLWDASSGPLANYHVHGLTVLPDDTILAFTEGRHEVCDAGPRDLLVELTDTADGYVVADAVRFIRR